MSESDAKNPLLAELEKAKKDMHAALSNSFDTPQAMRIIQDLIGSANTLSSGRAEEYLPALKKLAEWITEIVGIFGLDEHARPPYNGLGWAAKPLEDSADPKEALSGLAKAYETVSADVKALNLSSDSIDTLLSKQDPASESMSAWASGVRDLDQLALPYARAVSALRDELRRIVPTASAESKKAILALTDRIRDEDLTNVGVYLDDRADGKRSLIKFVPASELIALRNEKLAKEAEKARAKEEAKRAREQADKEKWGKAKVAPADMFRADDKYAEWDAEGLPTKLKEGGEVPKNQLKKLQKDWQKQKKLHEEYLAKFGKP